MHTLLLVDDDAEIRELGQITLQLYGYKVDTVGSGEEALDYLRSHEVDLLVLDMNMAGIDGAETYRQSLRLRPGQRAIVVSGDSLCDRVVEALEMGASAYLCKPVKAERLAEAVRTALEPAQ